MAFGASKGGNVLYWKTWKARSRPDATLHEKSCEKGVRERWLPDPPPPATLFHAVLFSPAFGCSNDVRHIPSLTCPPHPVANMSGKSIA